MAGTINSLGIGSGVLTADVIEKLKSNDTKLIITPIDNRIALQKQKSNALDLLKSLLTTFKSSTSALGDDILYQKRSVTGNNSGINVTASAGVSVQSFSISDVQMATKNVQESGQFLSSTALVASGAGTMKLSVSGLTYNINYTATTTLEQLKESINTVAGAKAEASILQVGQNDYRLVLRSVDSGSDQTISISDSAGGSLSSQLLPYSMADANLDGLPDNPNGMQEIQAAGDATFKYNGITITRPSNEISDIITGVTISLLENNSTANISITQDVNAISDEVKGFVENYNSLMSQIKDMTVANVEEGKIGIFNGDNSINLIAREINRSFSFMSEGGLSLAQFGIDLNETGTMSFNSSKFSEKFNTDPTSVEKFFNGYMKTDVNGNDTEVAGIFSTMNSLLERYTKSSGLIDNLTNGSTNELKALNTNRARSMSLIEARYEAMTARFIQYDAIMSRLTSQFSALQQQIQMTVNAKD